MAQCEGHHRELLDRHANNPERRQIFQHFFDVGGSERAVPMQPAESREDFCVEMCGRCHRGGLWQRIAVDEQIDDGRRIDHDGDW